MRRWLFVDEQPEQSQACANLLNQPGEFEVETIEPKVDVTFLRDAIAGESLDGVLLDHALNDARPDINYTGSTLAAFIRSDYGNLPIVILSAKLSDQTELNRYRRTEDLFDLQLDKQDLQLQATAARNRLIALGDGYKRLHETLSSDHTGDHEAVCDLLGIHGTMVDGTDQSTMVQLVTETGAGDPSRIAHFLLQVALRLPGPLVDARRAAVGAGLTPGPEAQAFIAPAAFTGVFAGIRQGGMYWREMLVNLSGDRSGLQPARCVACDGDASCVCEVCEKPVDGLHSLPVQRNEVANDVFLRGRICAYCLAGELPGELTLDSRYATMRDSLVEEVLGTQE